MRDRCAIIAIIKLKRQIKADLTLAVQQNLKCWTPKQVFLIGISDDFCVYTEAFESIYTFFPAHTVKIIKFFTVGASIVSTPSICWKV